MKPHLYQGGWMRLQLLLNTEKEKKKNFESAAKRFMTET
jgi:hypothetical protein